MSAYALVHYLRLFATAYVTVYLRNLVDEISLGSIRAQPAFSTHMSKDCEHRGRKGEESAQPSASEETAHLCKFLSVCLQVNRKQRPSVSASRVLKFKGASAEGKAAHRNAGFR